MVERVYLDWNATAPLHPEARAAALAALDVVGNPSSVHAEGRAALRLVEQAREGIATLVGASARNVVFTSGGTEANVLALSPATAAEGGEPCQELLVSAIEHPSMLAGGRFDSAAVDRVPVDKDGRADLTALEVQLGAAVARGVRPLISLMLANNETGIIQPISKVAKLVHAAGGLLLVDAVQAFGRIPCNINELGADLLTLSGHKIGAPKGVGALIHREDGLRLCPVLTGGGQERGARAGTQNVAAIAAFGAAAVAAERSRLRDAARMRILRERLETGLREITPDVVIFGERTERLPNTTLFGVRGMKAETAVIAFDLAGVAVSSGAACSSGKVQPSHVLEAMGAPASLARAAVRVSLGWTTTEEHIDRLLHAWITLSGPLLDRTKEIAA
jgi:cysteine desulfurase